MNGRPQHRGNRRLVIQQGVVVGGVSKAIVLAHAKPKGVAQVTGSRTAQGVKENMTRTKKNKTYSLESLRPRISSGLLTLALLAGGDIGVVGSVLRRHCGDVVMRWKKRVEVGE